MKDVSSIGCSPFTGTQKLRRNKKKWAPLRRDLVFLLISLMCVTACRQTKDQTDRTTGAKPVTDSSLITSCPFFCRDDSGRPVLSWVQQASPSAAARMYYAVYDARRGSFGSPRLIPSATGLEAHGEDMPKLIYGQNGAILAIYNTPNPTPGNPYTGKVSYTQSFDKGVHWTDAAPLVRDSSGSYDQRYFDVAQLPDGQVGVVWLNDSKPDGSSLCFARTQGTQGFSEARVIARHTCQCCRTDLMTDDAGNIHIAWRGIQHDSIRDMMYCRSADSGKHFSTPRRISADNWVIRGCPHTGPSMAANKDGIHFSWFTMGGGGGIYYCRQQSESPTFSPRQTVSDRVSARHPQIIALPTGALALVWDEGAGSGKDIYQRIMLQQRGPSGLLIHTRPLTAKGLNASFPQIIALDNQSALVAYTVYSGQKQQVQYQVVRL
jgi:hypothetical protein